jgi:hypothetical protein
MQGCVIQVILVQNKWVGIDPLRGGGGEHIPPSLKEKAEGLYF